MLGETYDRFIAGEAVKAKTSPLYLPDDGQFHGIGKRAQYKMDSYWDTNHVRPPVQPSCSEESDAVISSLGARGRPMEILWSCRACACCAAMQIPPAA